MMFLTREPEHPAEDLREEIDGLRQQISDLELLPAISSDKLEHSQLLMLARETVSDGETVYAQSIAGGSGLGELNEARYDKQASVYAWLHRQVFVGSQNSLRDVTP
jgi:hypothetical protein